MGRKPREEICKVCGKQARRINYVSKSKGRTYHYFKYVHKNGVVHYFRQPSDKSDGSGGINYNPGISIFEALENVIDLKMIQKELRFGEIKSLLESNYGRSIGVATIYRNINKLLKLGILSKRTNEGVVLYSHKPQYSLSQEIQITNMSLGFDLTQEETSMTIFVHVRNSGIRMITGVPMSLPVGPIESFDSINLMAYDGIKTLKMSSDNIAYSYPGRTGITLPLNKPLKSKDEEDLMVNLTTIIREKPIKTNILSDVDFLRIRCETMKGKEITIKKILVDGFKEIEPVLIKRIGTELGHTIVEADFENAMRGETVAVSILQ